MSVLVTGSHGCVGAWVLEALVEAGRRPVAYDLSEVIGLIRECVPGAKTLITCDAGTEVPVAGADAALQRDLGPLPRTSLRDGVRQTIARFGRLLTAGRLDTRELA